MRARERSRGFTALKIEGGILPPEFLQTVASLDAPRQTGADYGLSKSLAIKEELARYWRIASDLHRRYAERRQRRDLSAAGVGIDEWLVPFLSTVLGHDDLTAAAGPVELEDRVFRLTHGACGGAVPLLLVTRDVELDKADSRFGHDGRRQAPHGMMQEYLNAEDEALWGMVSNGSKLRILRDNPSLTRPACIEADLDLMFAEELYPDFAAFWLIAHASRLRPVEGKPANCIVESWRREAHETGERVRENLRDGVTESLRLLGNGFLRHCANGRLRQALESGALSSERYFQQLLRLVYRLLFLFATEERDLLHAPAAGDTERAVYNEGYALSRLRERALRRRHHDRNHDLWQGLSITFRALAEGARPLGLPALGGLFRADQCPDLDAAAIANEHLLEAVRTLAFFRSDRTLARVNYRDMDTEELGSVYESLLELRPVIDVDASPWTFAFAGDPAGDTAGDTASGVAADGSDRQRGRKTRRRSRGSERKLTGSYYTPPSLVGELIRSTLDPVIAQAVASRPEDPRAAVLALKVVDPACGSGHFLLAAARRLAVEIARIESGDDTVNEDDRQRALREVMQHCIYGVDRNPLAVELCRTALWMETIEPGKPLTFLDAHILQGDSLIGVLDPKIMEDGIPAAACKPLTGDDKAVCKDLARRNRQSGQQDLFDQDAPPAAATGPDVDSMPEDTLADIERKRATWEQALQDPARHREKQRADLFVAAWFAPKTPDTRETVPQTQDLHRLAAGQPQRRGVEERVESLARRHDFLHWHIEFAEIMQNGGFDAVLGNPPWEVSQLNEEEHFANAAPGIANLPGATRKRAIARLETSDPLLWSAYQIASRGFSARNGFCRGSDRYSLSAYGKLNSYALFAETFLQLLGPRGRAGLIVPTGIATDHSTRAFFEHVVSGQRLASLYDFENREAVFPGVHRSYKFCLLVLAGSDSPVPEAEFAFFLHQAEQLKEAERRFTLSPDNFSLFNPNTRTCPIFRTRRDMEVARKMYQRAGVFWQEAVGAQPEDNPWGVSFMQMFNMTSDSGLFRTRADMEADGWELEGNIFAKNEERSLPLYEAKLFHQYDHRFATFEGASDRDIRNGNARPMTRDERADPRSAAIPRYWVPEPEVAQRLDNKAQDVYGHSPNRRTAEPPNRRTAEPFSGFSIGWPATRSQEDHQRHERENECLRHDPGCGTERLWHYRRCWLIVFRDISSPTNQRTTILAVARDAAMSNKAPVLDIDYRNWLWVFRGITNSTNERTFLADHLPRSGVGNSAPAVDHKNARAVASALVLANMNSLPLDWAARFSVGGVNMNFFIVKQLPVLPPEQYLNEAAAGQRYVELVVPRALELTYTSHDLAGFAADLGFEGPPFPWNEDRRHRLRSELDAIFARMYGLNRPDLEWILDAQPPSASFPALKKNELKQFGEYRTQRYVLQAFHQLEQGCLPNLADAGR